MYGMELRDMDEGEQPLYRRPVPMGMGALVLSVVLY